jgi:hypothetical protein
MTDPQTGSELVIVNTPAGERQLKRLSPADWVKLSNTLRATRKAEIRAELGASVAARTQAINTCLAGVREKLKAAPQDKAERLIQDALASALDATEAEARKRLDEFDRRPLKYRDVESFINTMEGQYAAILYSLQKDNPQAGEAEFNELAVPPQDWLDVTGRLLNVPIVVTRVGPDGPLPGTGESPPSPPPHASTTATGTPTPAESAST